MIYEEGSIILDGKTYKAIKTDYNSYDTEYGQISFDNNTYKAQKKYGVEEFVITKYILTQTILQDGTCKLELTTNDDGTYTANSTILANHTQKLEINSIGG